MDVDRIDCYRVEGRIGMGGMGEVYRAWDENLKRPVALKLIRSERSHDETERERFRREAQAVARLKHPAVVQVHRVFEWRDRLVIVMELVEGRTLKECLRQGGLEYGEALKLAREIADGLAAAHAQGIVHRDLKTENVMVTTEGHAKILDFGVAKILNQAEATLTARGSVLGTLHTMAPEQAQGKAVDPRSDLFSF